MRTEARNPASALIRNPATVVGLALLGAFALVPFVHSLLLRTWWRGPVYAPETGFDPAIAHPSGASRAHLLGTDPLGRDVLSLLMHSTRPTLVLAAAVVGTVAVTATASAAASAYRRGRAEGVLSHLSDALILVPPPLAMIVAGLGRSGMGPLELGILYGVLTGLGAAAIVLRSQALAIMQRGFVEAGRIAGGGASHIIRVHLLPSLVPLAAVQMMLSVTGAVIAYAFIQFWGGVVGVTRVGYGNVIYHMLFFQGGLEIAWTPLLAAGLTISLFCGAFYLVAVGLRQTLEPELWHPRRLT